MQQREWAGRHYPAAWAVLRCRRRKSSSGETSSRGRGTRNFAVFSAWTSPTPESQGLAAMSHPTAALEDEYDMKWILLAGLIVLMVLLVVRLSRKKPPSDELFR